MRVQVFAPCALSEDVPDSEKGDYHCIDGVMLTEWNPKFQLYVDERLRKISGVTTQWHFIHNNNYRKIIDELVTEHQKQPIVIFSLVDGQDNVWPGIDVVRALEQSGLPFTGADSRFFEMDTSKSVMKQHLINCCPHLTPNYQILGEQENLEAGDLVDLTYPVLVKPSRSSGSRGITSKSLVYNSVDAVAVANQVAQQYDGCYMEEFVTGAEFTCFVTGSSTYGIKAYSPVQRVFNNNLASEQQFLSFDMKWQQWSAQPNQASWWYAGVADSQLEQMIKSTAIEVFKSLDATGYARMDLRQCSKTGRLYVIDVNANCSIDGDDDSGLGIILKTQGIGLEVLLEDILQFALHR